MNNEDWDSLSRKLEPEAGLGHSEAVEGPALVSLAVSAVRIADALEVLAAATFMGSTFDVGGEGAAAAIKAVGNRAMAPFKPGEVTK